MVDTVDRPAKSQEPVAWEARQNRRFRSDHPEIWSLLDGVSVPEIPAISLWDLGVLNDVEQKRGEIIITIIPTYSDNPATESIQEALTARMDMAGYYHVSVVKAQDPKWSIDFMTPTGREILLQQGIAPPMCQKSV